MYARRIIENLVVIHKSSDTFLQSNWKQGPQDIFSIFHTTGFLGNQTSLKNKINIEGFNTQNHHLISLTNVPKLPFHGPLQTLGIEGVFLHQRLFLHLRMEGKKQPFKKAELESEAEFSNWSNLNFLYLTTYNSCNWRKHPWSPFPKLMLISMQQHVNYTVHLPSLVHVQ